MSKKSILLVVAGLALIAVLVAVRAAYVFVQARLEEQRRQEQIAQAQDAMKQMQQQLGAYAQPANMPGPANPDLPTMPPGQYSPAVQAAFLQLVQKHQISAGIAAYLAQAKAQVLSQSSNSARFSLTFPDGITAETTITITPGHYVPNAAEIARAQTTGVQTYRVQFSSESVSETKARIVLRYFVPNAVVPAGLQPRLQANSASFFQFVPDAYAQEGGNLGMDVATDTGIEVAKEVLKQQAEHGKVSKHLPVPLSRFVDVLNAFKKETEHLDWLDQLRALEDCAKNPTNPLTQKAFQDDPNYQQQTLEGIADARSDVTQMTGMRYLNLVTSVATDLVDGPLGAITSPISSYNDGTLKNLADDRVKETGGLVSCGEAPPPPEKNRGDGRITFRTQLQYFNGLDKYERLVESDFELVRDANSSAGVLRIHGIGDFKQNSESAKYKTKSKCKAQAEVSGNASSIMDHSMLTIGSNMINGSGDCEMVSAGRVFHSSNYQDPGAVCRFENVDLVNGGEYTVHADGEPAWEAGTECVLQLRPVQK
jgi:hypothetical protein